MQSTAMQCAERNALMAEISLARTDKKLLENAAQGILPSVPWLQARLMALLGQGTRNVLQLSSAIDM